MSRSLAASMPFNGARTSMRSGPADVSEGDSGYLHLDALKPLDAVTVRAGIAVKGLGLMVWVDEAQLDVGPGLHENVPTSEQCNQIVADTLDATVDACEASGSTGNTLGCLGIFDPDEQTCAVSCFGTCYGPLEGGGGDPAEAQCPLGF